MSIRHHLQPNRPECVNIQRLREILGWQVCRQILFMQTLTTEFIEFYFIGEIASNDFFHFLADWWFEVVFIDLGQVFGAICNEVNTNTHENTFSRQTFRRHSLS